MPWHESRVGNVSHHGAGLVGEVIDRQSELLDPPIANVDQVLLVFAASDPPVRPLPSRPGPYTASPSCPLMNSRMGFDRAGRCGSLTSRRSRGSWWPRRSLGSPSRLFLTSATCCRRRRSAGGQCQQQQAPPPWHRCAVQADPSVRALIAGWWRSWGTGGTVRCPSASTPSSAWTLLSRRCRGASLCWPAPQVRGTQPQCTPPSSLCAPLAFRRCGDQGAVTIIRYTTS